LHHQNILYWSQSCIISTKFIKKYRVAQLFPKKYRSLWYETFVSHLVAHSVFVAEHWFGHSFTLLLWAIGRCEVGVCRHAKLLLQPDRNAQKRLLQGQTNYRKIEYQTPNQRRAKFGFCETSPTDCAFVCCTDLRFCVCGNDRRIGRVLLASSAAFAHSTALYPTLRVSNLAFFELWNAFALA
jgi:hypothetical protein